MSLYSQSPFWMYLSIWLAIHLASLMSLFATIWATMPLSVLVGSMWSYWMVSKLSEKEFARSIISLPLLLFSVR